MPRNSYGSTGRVIYGQFSEHLDRCIYEENWGSAGVILRKSELREA